MNTVKSSIRNTEQYELPVKKTGTFGYDIYPTHSIGDNKIFEGYESLADILVGEKRIFIDGFVGIIFDQVKERLQSVFDQKGFQPKWVNVEEAFVREIEIEKKVSKYLNGDDPVFGRITDLRLEDFFDPERLQILSDENKNGPVIFYGIGAAQIPTAGKLVYFDISKNEIQFRSRAGSVFNLGTKNSYDRKQDYKRFYFVDWVVLNNYKKNILDSIDMLVDGQRSETITWMRGKDWRNAVDKLTKHPFRVRPWFEPGAWGGDWVKKNINGLEKNVVNYAWSFELIVPENGVIVESSGLMLEFSFDCLMFRSKENVLGTDARVYGDVFPIRFDFLDTFDGDNLSIQCHPRLQYMKEHFGEEITQEETYYILDRQKDAKVYLGFQEGVKREEFHQALETSRDKGEPLNVTDYIQVFEAKKHDLFLIPPGAIHGSGVDNLVLEISSTPYIYTFKMYDWLRLDLDGKPRPLNIERGMDNVNFDLSGEKVREELISRPSLIEKTDDWELYHLPTHEDHLYDVHRYHIKTQVKIHTDNKVHVLSLVEGAKLEVSSPNGSTVYAFAETFVIPAATGQYTIKNLSDKPIMVVKAFIKG